MFLQYCIYFYFWFNVIFLKLDVAPLAGAVVAAVVLVVELASKLLWNLTDMQVY